MSKYYSINEFSKILGVSAQTLRNWDNNGKLKPHHTSSNGYRYYSHEQLNELLNCEYKVIDDKNDELYINSIISISNVFYNNVSDKSRNVIDSIKELIEGGDDNDKINKSNVNPK